MTSTKSCCRFCGMTHGVLCPTVKAIEYFEDGVTVKRVEFKGASDYALPPLPAAPMPSPWAPSPWPITVTSLAQSIKAASGTLYNG